MAIGIATAVILLVNPRPMKAQPSSLINLRHVARRGKSVLNILQTTRVRIELEMNESNRVLTHF